MNSVALHSTDRVSSEGAPSLDWRFRELGLSRQESRVVELAMAGNIDKQIATEMGISLGTVRVYWKRIRFKTGGTRSEAIASLAKESYQRDFDRVQQRADSLQEAIDRQADLEARLIAYEEAFLASALPVVIVDAATGEVRRSNESFETRYAGAAMSKCLFDSAERAKATFAELGATPSPVVLTLPLTEGGHRVTFQACGDPRSIAVLWNPAV